QQHTDLDCLAEADVIRNQPVQVARSQYPMHQVDLVRQRVDIEVRKCASVFIPQLKSIGQTAQTQRFRPSLGVNLAGFEQVGNAPVYRQMLCGQPHSSPLLDTIDQCLL